MSIIQILNIDKNNIILKNNKCFKEPTINLMIEIKVEKKVEKKVEIKIEVHPKEK